MVLGRDMRGKVSRRRGTGDDSSESVSARGRCKAFGLSPSGIPVHCACVVCLGLGARHCFVVLLRNGVELEEEFCRLLSGLMLGAACSVFHEQGFLFGSWVSLGLRSARVCFRED